jgi:beta-lactamase regulating signal transducer with metallopeptidase domain
VHGAKAFSRPVANTVTAGVAAPVLSGAEDVTSVALSFVAILVPILVVLILVLMIVAAVLLIRRRIRVRRARRAAVPTVVP